MRNARVKNVSTTGDIKDRNNTNQIRMYRKRLEAKGKGRRWFDQKNDRYNHCNINMSVMRKYQNIFQYLNISSTIILLLTH